MFVLMGLNDLKWKLPTSDHTADLVLQNPQGRKIGNDNLNLHTLMQMAKEICSHRGDSQD